MMLTSESVSQGHPDKLCDEIADAILDACLAQDKMSRTAVEVMATREYILIAGEVTTNAHVDYEQIARNVLKGVGYTSPEIGIGCDTCTIDVKINTQSPDIALGVNNADLQNLGAGDQGIIYGYATNETEEMLPLPFAVAHKLTEKAYSMFKEGKLPHARPDMKSQVTIDYSKDKPIADTVVLSCQHDDAIPIDFYRNELKSLVILPVLEECGLKSDKILINPTGRFVIGGPLGDTGLTGRKLMVDTYGGLAPNGGGAFSGKDATKVDRSAAYMARFLAKSIIRRGLCDRCLIQVAYAIGVSQPVSISLNSYGVWRGEKISQDALIEHWLKYDMFTPYSMIELFGLRKPKGFAYLDLAKHGHFTNATLPWERYVA